MQTYVDLKNIYETVNNEFSKRIQDTDTAKKSLEKELARVSYPTEKLTKCKKKNAGKHVSTLLIFAIHRNIEILPSDQLRLA